MLDKGIYYLDKGVYLDIGMILDKHMFYPRVCISIKVTI